MKNSNFHFFLPPPTSQANKCQHCTDDYSLDFQVILHHRAVLGDRRSQSVPEK